MSDLALCDAINHATILIEEVRMGIAPLSKCGREI